MPDNSNYTTGNILSRFNNRDKEAFAQIYERYYNELHLYASKLYSNTIVESEDAVQDIFIDIWQNNHLKFDSLAYLKGFIFIALKNRYKNHLRHSNVESEYIKRISEVENYFEVDMFQNTLYTEMEQLLGLLPTDYANILLLHIEGWSASEISKKLDVPIQTIYNKKHKAIELIKLKAKKGSELFVLAIHLSGL